MSTTTTNNNINSNPFSKANCVPSCGAGGGKRVAALEHEVVVLTQRLAGKDAGRWRSRPNNRAFPLATETSQ